MERVVFLSQYDQVLRVLICLRVKHYTTFFLRVKFSNHLSLASNVFIIKLLIPKTHVILHFFVLSNYIWLFLSDLLDFFKVVKNCLLKLFSLDLIELDEFKLSLLLRLMNFAFHLNFVVNFTEQFTPLLFICFEENGFKFSYPLFVIFKIIHLSFQRWPLITCQLLNPTTFYHNPNPFHKNVFFNVLDFTYMAIIVRVGFILWKIRLQGRLRSSWRSICPFFIGRFH